MPLQNRVLPTSQIVADPARGLFTGNRGCLHDDHRQLGRARYKGKAWISCTLQYKDVRRQVMTPRRWTELFFLDEAVAMAAGHRPCALCRRAAYHEFRAAWGDAPRAVAMDAALHLARLGPNGQQRRFQADCAQLPDGCLVLWQGQAHLVRGDALLPYAPQGYGARLPRPDAVVTVLTPAPMVAVLTAGYRPVVHPTAGQPT